MRVVERSALAQQLKGFAVTAALEEMAEFGIDLRRQGLFEALDSFGNVAEPFGVASGIAAAFFVGDMVRRRWWPRIISDEGRLRLAIC